MLEDDPPRPRSRAKDLPRDLEVICLKAMHKSPAGRYASAAEMARDLDRYEQGQPILARSTGVVERTLRWCRRNPLAVGVLAAVLVGLVGGAPLSVEPVRILRAAHGPRKRPPGDENARRGLAVL